MDTPWIGGLATLLRTAAEISVISQGAQNKHMMLLASEVAQYAAVISRAVQDSPLSSQTTDDELDRIRSEWMHSISEIQAVLNEMKAIIDRRIHQDKKWTSKNAFITKLWHVSHSWAFQERDREIFGAARERLRTSMQVFQVGASIRNFDAALRDHEAMKVTAVQQREELNSIIAQQNEALKVIVAQQSEALRAFAVTRQNGESKGETLAWNEELKHRKPTDEVEASDPENSREKKSDNLDLLSSAFVPDEKTRTTEDERNSDPLPPPPYLPPSTLPPLPPQTYEGDGQDDEVKRLGGHEEIVVDKLLHIP